MAVDKRLDDTWLIDSCASIYQSAVNDVKVADNTKLYVAGQGNVILYIKSNSIINKLLLKNVLYIPNLSQNLLSVGRFDKDGYYMNFYKQTCKMYDRNRKLLFTGCLLHNNIYKLNLRSHGENASNIFE